MRMNLKDLVNKIKPSFNYKKNSEQKRLEKGVVAVQNVYEQSESQKEANKKAMDEDKELLETNLERVEGLEDVNPLRHSEHNTEL